MLLIFPSPVFTPYLILLGERNGVKEREGKPRGIKIRRRERMERMRREGKGS